MAVTVETAAVFRGGGRRWFTLRAACAAEARAMLKSTAIAITAKTTLGAMSCHVGFITPTDTRES